MVIPKFGKLTWTIIGGISVILGVFGGFYKIDDRYAKADDIPAVEKNIEEKTVLTFEKFQMKQEAVTDALRLQILNIEYENLTDRYYNLKREAKLHPTDEDIKAELNNVIKQREAVKAKQEKILEKK